MKVYDNTENAINNSILADSQFDSARRRLQERLAEIKRKVSDNQKMFVSESNILTLLNLQFSIFLTDFEKLSFGVRLKVFMLFFARYIQKKELLGRFEDFDPEVDLLKQKNTLSYLNR